MSRTIISAEGLSKAYLIGLKRDKMATLSAAAARMLKSPLENFRRLRRLNTYALDDDADDVYWALKDVSFEIKEGEVVGVIGRNGAGKSTLLKLLSRITDPTRGRAVLRGRVSSLLEVGTGFHPELTGRENMYLNGTILGMSKREVDRKFDEIVEFSGIEKFLDTPIKRYSSGMTVRLAFAVAAHLEPELLIIDEVLAVGDAQFQERCLGKMQDIASGGRTVIFVSHDINAIRRLTNRCIVLNQGKVHHIAETNEAAEAYANLLKSGRPTQYVSSTLKRLDHGDGRLRFESVAFSQPNATVETFGDIEFTTTIHAVASVDKPRLSYSVFGATGNILASGFCPLPYAMQAGHTAKCDLILRNCPLAPGQYHFGLTLGVGDTSTGIVDADTVLDVLHLEVKPSTRDGVVSMWKPGWGQFVLDNVACSQMNSL